MPADETASRTDQPAVAREAGGEVLSGTAATMRYKQSQNRNNGTTSSSHPAEQAHQLHETNVSVSQTPKLRHSAVLHATCERSRAAAEEDLTTSLLTPPPQSSSPDNNNNNNQDNDSTTTHQSMIARLHYWRHMLVTRIASAQLAIRRLGHYLAYLTMMSMLIILPIVLYNALHDRKLDMAAYNSAWVMVCGTIILSVRLVYLHLTHWYMPAVQKYVVRIVWMVPLYATQSYLSLRFHEARIYIDCIRDFYEAYVIASFVYYLMELLGGQEAIVELLRQKDPAVVGRHVFPLSLILERWELGEEFTVQCKHGVLQYVVFKTISTILIMLCEAAGIYGEGTFDWFSAYPYICFFQNLSVMYALYCLVMLYQAVEEELRHPVNWRPLGKFLCVKAVVFFCWWQGVLIFYLRAHGIIEDLGSWSSEDVAYGLIDYCIVLEMVGFAVAHSYTFTYKEYLPSNVPAVGPVSSSNSGAAAPHEQVETRRADAAASLPLAHDAPPSSLYRPPATLPQPMRFKDAFWSSTVPKETIQDIQRLRSDFLNNSFRSTCQGSQHRERTTSSTTTRGSSEEEETPNSSNGDIHADDNEHDVV